jgi:predicted nucleic acid-binding protein
MTSSSKPIVIIDTNVLSYGFKGGPPAFIYARLLADYECQISFMTLEELRWGVEKARWSQRRRLEIELMVNKFPVVQPTDRMATLCAKLRAERHHAGRPIETADAWIAATAIALDVPLATHDANFKGTPGLKLIMADQNELRVLPPLRFGARPTRPLDPSCHCSL